MHHWNNEKEHDMIEKKKKASDSGNLQLLIQLRGQR